ncbi:MAG: VacB/RNase II family 3'-5' exoribonuclease [Firmicutes bacterium]|nr:VacB/RNase II family 3'-5' exoribonuclease [Bacillota bacterium]
MKRYSERMPYGRKEGYNIIRQDDFGGAFKAKLTELGLDAGFPRSVTQSAARLNKPAADRDLDGRRDYRRAFVFTIDGDGAKDFDDAVSIERTADGYRLCVHISDVSHYVKEGGDLDRETYARATSVYYPGGVTPMLPPSLSEGICSLIPGEDRLTITAVMDFAGNGELIQYEFCKSAINSRRRMTYAGCNQILAGESEAVQAEPEVSAALAHMSALAAKLKERADKRGALGFEIPEAEITLQDGAVIDVRAKQRGVSERIIEEFMIAANVCAARTAESVGLPFIYRVHGAPSAERSEALVKLFNAVGISVKHVPESPAGYKELLEKMRTQAENAAESVGHAAMLSYAMLRSMQKAVYSDTDTGHFGLALDAYCHFTSPIRRYPDLIVHRILSGHLAGKNMSRLAYALAGVARHCSERERAADEAERALDDICKTAYMSDRLGDRYTGTISGVTDFGIFVELDNTCEGLVRIDNLPPASYTFFEDEYRLAGGGREYRLGGRMDVTVAAADIPAGKAAFVPAEQGLGKGSGIKNSARVTGSAGKKKRNPKHGREKNHHQNHRRKQTRRV